MKIEALLDQFLHASKRYGVYTIERNPRKANQAYDDLYEIALQLRESGDLEKLRTLLSYDDPATRMWAAVYLLVIDEKTALPILEQISAEKSPFAFETRISLEEWRKGNLKLFRD